MIFSDYNSIFFDCDGVILNSNKIKSDAFYTVTKRFGENHAKTLYQYHIENGGISRFEKFRYLFSDVLKTSFDEALYNKLLENYANEVLKQLLDCEVANGLEQLRDLNPNAKWLVASGGKETELKEVFEAKNISHYFESGIYGSPTKKNDIVQREIAKGIYQKPYLFIGDSYYDFAVAKEFKMDFCFVSKWSEWKDSSKYFNEFTYKLDSIDDFLKESSND